MSQLKREGGGDTVCAFLRNLFIPVAISEVKKSIPWRVFNGEPLMAIKLIETARFITFNFIPAVGLLSSHYSLRIPMDNFGRE